MRRVFFIALILLFAGFFSGYAQDNEQAVVSDGSGLLDVTAIMDKLEQKRQSIHHFQSEFEQIKVIMPFEETERSTGLFLFKAPDRVIWEFNQPERTKVLVKGSRGFVISPAVKQVQIFRIDEYNRFDFLLAGLGKPIYQFLDDFSMQCAGDTLEDGTPVYVFVMEPINESLSSVVSQCEITVSAVELVPLSTKIIETSGDITTLIFSGININSDMDDSLFEYVIPPDYEVIDYR
ncbi:MAG: outer membrane lipoprotein carrier protein LolA [Candidatus Auribacterota bacterium]|jgi:outer membrane lipoprotein-sorting protein|nr:outer membrane lipoprotein carrier protein LolA [Candidatus Auribacterota bacterium]